MLSLQRKNQSTFPVMASPPRGWFEEAPLNAGLLLFSLARSFKRLEVNFGKRHRHAGARRPSPPIAHHTADETLALIVDLDEFLTTLIAALDRHGLSIAAQSVRFGRRRKRDQRISGSTKKPSQQSRGRLNR